MRRTLPALFTIVVAISLIVPPAAAGPAGDEAPLPAWLERAADGIWKQFGDPSFPPPSPANRLGGLEPKPAGTIENFYLDTGPHVIGPGMDLSRLDFHLATATGYTLETRMFVIDAITGETISGHDVHTHHAHLIALDPQNPNYYRWIYGTGEEMTGGSVDARAAADPRYRKGLRYGMFIEQGERLAVLSMLHNKTAEPRLAYLRVWSRFVHGTREEIKAATGQDFHNLTSQIFGGTFNVPRTGGHYFWPKDLTDRIISKDENARGGTTASPTGPASIKPGVGVTWTSPWTGQIAVVGGHLHGGGTQAYLSNLGSKERPCGNRDGDKLPGTTISRSAVFGRGGLSPTDDFQMGLTQNAWRAWVRKGDVLVANGGYNAQTNSWPDAMLFFGVYIDQDTQPPASAGCSPWLINKPKASKLEVTRSVINHPWNMYPRQHVCHPGHCETPGPPPAPGPAAPGNVVHIADFAYLPGQQGASAPPVVQRGDPLTFVNEDYSLGLVRHSVTSCKAPCNGMATSNYPYPDGVLDSGPMGYMVEDAYVSYQTTPTWELDTATLNPGYYVYYCRLHAFMRGAFYVE